MTLDSKELTDTHTPALYPAYHPRLKYLLINGGMSGIQIILDLEKIMPGQSYFRNSLGLGSRSQMGKTFLKKADPSCMIPSVCVKHPNKVPSYKHNIFPVN